MEQKFKFEMGEPVMLLGGYMTGTVVGRGVMEHIEGHSVTTYLVLFEDKQVMMSEQVLKGKGDKS